MFSLNNRLNNYLINHHSLRIDCHSLKIDYPNKLSMTDHLILLSIWIIRILVDQNHPLIRYVLHLRLHNCKCKSSLSSQLLSFSLTLKILIKKIGKYKKTNNIMKDKLRKSMEWQKICLIILFHLSHLLYGKVNLLINNQHLMNVIKQLIKMIKYLINMNGLKIIITSYWIMDRKRNYIIQE